MRLSAIEAVKEATKGKFEFKGTEFAGFEDISTIELEKNLVELDKIPEIGLDSEQIDIWANISIGYSGNPPESYRVLNHMIMDWVDDNESELKKEINPPLIEFLKDKYPEIDVSDLNKDFDDYIWEDQVDYYPEIDTDHNKINFIIELVLEIELEEE